MEDIIRVRVEQFIKDPLAVGRFVKRGVWLLNQPNPDFTKFWKEINDASTSPK